MVESQVKVQCLYGSSVFDLKLDFLQIKDISEVLAKVEEFVSVSGVAPSQLHFVYSDDATPVAHLDICGPEDLQCLQTHIAQLGCTDVFFQLDQSGRLESTQVVPFFSKGPASPCPLPSKATDVEEAKVELESARAPSIEIQRFAFPYSLAVSQMLPPKTSLKQHDFMITSDSSLIEPDSVPANTLFTRRWRLLVSGCPWTQESLICVRGRQLGARVTLARKEMEIAVEMQVQTAEEPVSLAFRLELDGEICGPLLWAEVVVKAEQTIEERLTELGASPLELNKLKNLADIGLTDLPKLMKAWSRSYYKEMDDVANLYYGEED